MSIADQIPLSELSRVEALQHELRILFRNLPGIQSQILPKGHLGRDDSMSMVETLCQDGFRAGGGPTLCPWLPDLIRRASELRVTSSVVTNGSRITDEWVEGVGEILD